MAITAWVVLMPIPSSRGAERPPDAECSLVFASLPQKGDILSFDENAAWPEDLRGRHYMVNGTEWPLSPGYGSKPRVEGIRCG